MQFIGLLLFESVIFQSCKFQSHHTHEGPVLKRHRISRNIFSFISPYR